MDAEGAYVSIARTVGIGPKAIALLAAAVAASVLAPAAACRVLGVAGLPCDTEADCPATDACVAGLCARTTDDAGRDDAGPDDAGPDDAGTDDAGTDDAGFPGVCGNGVTEAPEQCDDGSQNDDNAADACRTSCVRAGCGDLVIDSGESCDDGNTNQDDGCTTACDAPRCGDSLISAGEQCDDGNNVSSDACISCVAAACGDGIVHLGVEGCDDGGANDDALVDACRTSCFGAGCGDGVIDTGEQCDTPGDAALCTRACRTPVCGDGMVSPGEACDDGNDNDLDGCRSSAVADCLVVDGFGCCGEPSVCQPSAAVVRVPAEVTTVREAVATAATLLCVAAGHVEDQPVVVDRATAVAIVGVGAPLPVIDSAWGNALEVNGGVVLVQGLALTSRDEDSDIVDADQGGTAHLRLVHNVIGPGAGEGVRCVDGGPTTTLEMTGNLVWRCANGGVRVEGAYQIEGNIIAQNGGNGVELTSVLGGAFRGNTVADHRFGNGVDCDTNGTPIVGNICWRNSEPMSSECAPSSSIFEGGSTTPTGNLDVDPRFRGADDYHLSSGSPAIDQVDMPASRDVDLQERPLGVRGDIGADEAR